MTHPPDPNLLAQLWCQALAWPVPLVWGGQIIVGVGNNDVLSGAAQLLLTALGVFLVGVLLVGYETLLTRWTGSTLLSWTWFC